IFFFFQAEDGIRDFHVTGVQTCALPIWRPADHRGTKLRPRGMAGNGRAIVVIAFRDDWIAVVRAALDEVELVAATWPHFVGPQRSEERRVGKECRSRWREAPL